MSSCLLLQRTASRLSDAVNRCCVCKEASRDNFEMSDLKLKEFEARPRRETQTSSFHIFGPAVCSAMCLIFGSVGSVGSGSGSAQDSLAQFLVDEALALVLLRHGRFASVSDFRPGCRGQHLISGEN